MRYLMISAAALALTACSQDGSGETVGAAEDATPETVEETVAEDVATDESAGKSLSDVLASQPDNAKARYKYRHPQGTLEFFGVAPGMTIVDTLPGDPFYSGILSEYLGADGKVIGADYPVAMWSNFDFASEEFIEGKRSWTGTWVSDMEEKRLEGEAPFAAFQIGELSADLVGTADLVLMVRASHNLHRFETDSGFMTQAMADMNAVLKPGGTLGVIQHRAPDANSDEWADGSNGYLKQSSVIAFAEAAGFELVDSSEINANPKDQPTEDDIVWRLPPSLGTSQENAELRAEMEAIGESDRMTLKFRKAE